MCKGFGMVERVPRVNLWGDGVGGEECFELWSCGENSGRKNSKANCNRVVCIGQQVEENLQKHRRTRFSSIYLRERIGEEVV